MCRAIGVVLGAAAMAILAFCPARAEDVTFAFVPPPGSVFETVSVRGTFNGWNETAMELEPDGTWSVTIDLPPGEHQYKYYLNGEWPGDMEIGLGVRPIDPDAHGYVPDGYGGQNAIRVVGSSRPPEARHRYGYSVEGDEIVFELNLADCEVITTSDGRLLGLPDVSIDGVAVAGEFNSWSTEAWPMNRIDSGVYELRRPKADFDGRPEWLFKFVAGGSNWMEPPRRAVNVSPVGENTMSNNLVLRTGGGPTSLQRLTLPESERGDRCRLKPLSHGRGASIIPMSSNPMVTTDRDVIGILMTFVMPPTAEEEAAFESEMENVPAERATGRIREIMRERAALVSTAYVAVYEPSGGGPETGVYALLMDEPIPAEERSEFEQYGPSGFLMLRGRVAVMAWADGNDKSCLEALRAHVENVLPE
ncbi:MAG: hypothetical protein JXB46_00630 [Candidatus Eisenbacteria bacterium]|nr:hypothetical protein [Candidatus Eisenbacteria bacterium]